MLFWRCVDGTTRAVAGRRCGQHREDRAAGQHRQQRRQCADRWLPSARERVEARGRAGPETRHHERQQVRVRFNKVIEGAGKAITIDSGGIDLADWAYAMRGVSGDDVVTIKSNEGTFNQSPGNGTAEELDQTTINLLTAVRTDRVKGFLAAHPKLVAVG
ncbi:hypothetical protein GCM10009827_081480 [Dactylosporangium maewongense]|uniref:Uncharacterized protein n=1 Tax=Dactylosporangium maewongense TaxID=634393 RepID=A0ABN2BWG2_9ACTN